MKITFVTFHNWETKRIGGFHKLAAAASKAGHEVVFFSFDRPYFIYFKHEERLNRDVLKTLSQGKEYIIDDNSNKILNCTWPTLRIPNPIHRYTPLCINSWLQRHSLTPFSKFQEKYLKGTDVFVFESCNGIEIFDLIKKHNPKSILVYRPSDPIMVDGCDAYEIKQETKILQSTDINFIVNNAGLELYKSRIPNFEESVNYMILPNGVDTSMFKIKYPVPLPLNKPNTFLYVGARIIEWNLIKKTAESRPDYNFIIVCPENPPVDFLNSAPNIQYIPGIKPKDVPAWVCNADVIIVPNPKGWYKIKPWGITAKYYQAMEANRPIVAYEDTDELKDYGVFVSHDYDNFILMLDEALKRKDGMNYNFMALDWDEVSQRFLSGISELQL